MATNRPNNATPGVEVQLYSISNVNAIKGATSSALAGALISSRLGQRLMINDLSGLGADMERAITGGVT